MTKHGTFTSFSKPRHKSRKALNVEEATLVDGARPRLPVTEPAEFAVPEGAACPDLVGLGEPIGFDPRVFRVEAPLDRVVLAMALALNDFISVNWSLEQLRRGKPAAPRLDGYDGARLGIVLWNNRLLAAILNEILELFKEQHDLLTTDPDVARVVAAMTPDAQVQWQQLLALSVAAPAEGERHYLYRIRANLTYHYYEPKTLAKGYHQFFFEREKTPASEHAYISVGQAFSSIRCHFADAAVLGAGHSVAAAAFAESTPESGVDSIDALKLTVGSMLYAFVRAYIGLRLLRLEGKEDS